MKGRLDPCGSDGWVHFPTTTQSAPYLAFFWRDVGSSSCWRKGAGCAREFPVREQLAFVFFGGSTCAPSRKEKRMYLINATKLHRKSGVAKPRDLQFLSSSRPPDGEHEFFRSLF